MSGIDETHDPKRESWVASANGHTEFPIQNLPFGVFSPPGGAPRGGVAIGDMVFDLAAALEAGLFSGEAEKAAEAAAGPALNPLMALGAPARLALRRRVSELLAAELPSAPRSKRWLGGCCIPPANARCICPPRSANSPIFLPAFIMRAMAGAGATRTIRSAPITNTCRLPITAAPLRCERRTCRSGARMASARRRTNRADLRSVPEARL